jgi:hypothetical protein
LSDNVNFGTSGTGRFENEGTLILTEAARLSTNSGGPPVFINTGSIIKEAGTATGNNASSIVPIDLNHQGVLEVRSGILDLFGERQISAPMTVLDGAVLRLNGNETTTFLPGGAVVGDGSLEHRGSDIVIPAGVRTLFQNYSTPFGSGEVRGEGTFVITDDSTITRFNHVGPGTTEITGGADVVITPSAFRLSEGRVFHVRGSVDFPSRFSFSATNGMTLRNEGLMIFRDDSTWNHGGGRFLFENNGTIRIEAPVNDTVAFAPDEMSGAGLIEVVSGRLRFPRAVEVAGSIRLASGTRLSGTSLNLGSQSRVSGVGQIDGSVTLQGRVSPGLSIGTLAVSSSATFTTSGSLAVELGNGTSDQLTVTSTLDLGGLTIEPMPVAGDTPSNGDSWIIVTAGTITGSVGLVRQSAAAPGFGYFVSVDGNDLVLTYSAVESFQQAIEAATGLSLGNDPDLTAFATGDLDGDGVQDLTDWAYGGTLGGADPDRSLRVDSVTTLNPTTREVILAFPIRSGVSDVTMSLEGNTDLQGSFEQVIFAPVRTETRDGILFQVARVVVPSGPGDSFFRVRVELN